MGPSPFNDGRCVCGPAQSDWRPASDCGAAPGPAPGPAPGGSCAHCWYDGKDHTRCNPSPFNDGRCVCGPAQSDWRPASDCHAEVAAVNLSASGQGNCALLV